MYLTQNKAREGFESYEGVDLAEDYLEVTWMHKGRKAKEKRKLTENRQFSESLSGRCGH
jgi:hypothetical protein